jgi:hypothetical protein
MGELYIGDLASHGGPESCVGVREGVGEALTGVRVGGAIEPRNQPVRGADAVQPGGRQHRRSRYASGRRTPRGLRTQACAESPCARTGRPDDRPSVVDDAPSWMVRGVAYRRLGGPRGEGQGRSLR